MVTTSGTEANRTASTIGRCSTRRPRTTRSSALQRRTRRVDGAGSRGDRRCRAPRAGSDVDGVTCSGRSSRSRGCRRPRSRPCFRASSRPLRRRRRRPAGRSCRLSRASSGHCSEDAGFREGWQAHWMAVGIGALRDRRAPAGDRIGLARRAGSRPTCRGTAPASRAVRQRLARRSSAPRVARRRLEGRRASRPRDR